MAARKQIETHSDGKRRVRQGNKIVGTLPSEKAKGQDNTRSLKVTAKPKASASTTKTSDKSNDLEKMQKALAEKTQPTVELTENEMTTILNIIERQRENISTRDPYNDTLDDVADLIEEVNYSSPVPSKTEPFNVKMTTEIKTELKEILEKQLEESYDDLEHEKIESILEKID